MFLRAQLTKAGKLRKVRKVREAHMGLYRNIGINSAADPQSKSILADYARKPTIRQLSDNYKTTIRQLSDNYQTITF